MMPPSVLRSPRIIDRSGMLLVPVAHPAGSAALVDRQIVRASAAINEPLPGAVGKRALVLGSTSFGYGSSAAITLRQAGMEVIGLGFEVPPEIQDDGTPRKASPGWYLTRALHGRFPDSTTYLANAFSDETRDRVIADLKATGKGIDLIYYSVAAPGRSYRGQTWNSALKVLGDPLDLLGLKFTKGILEAVTLQPGTVEEAENTRRVMGGEDLELWVSGLLYAGLLNEGATVVALSYIGPQFEPLKRIYWEGTIGAAKKDIDHTTARINARLARLIGGLALTAMFPAVVTTASIQIPIIVRYLSMLLGAQFAGIWHYLDPLAVVVKFTEAMYGEGERWRGMLDSEGRLRMDEHELAAALQDFVQGRWELARPGDLDETTARGFAEFKRHFGRLFGFDVDEYDYSQPVEFDLPLGPEMGVHNLIGVEPTAGLYLPLRLAAPAPVTPAVPVDKHEEGRREMEAFFQTLLNRREPGVEVEAIMWPGAQAHYIVTHAFTPEEVGRYEAATGSLSKGPFEWVSLEQTFAAAFPAIFEAIKPTLREVQRKTIIHRSEEIESLAPISSGMAVKIDVTIKAVRRKKEAKLVVLERIVTNEEGSVVLAKGKTALFIGAEISIPQSTPEGKSVEADLTGAILVRPEEIDRYLEFDSNIIHRSDQAARALGLPGRIAQGMWIFRRVTRAAEPFFPEGLQTPLFPKRVEAKFVGVVQPGDQLQFQTTREGEIYKVAGKTLSAAGSRSVIEVEIS